MPWSPSGKMKRSSAPTKARPAGAREDSGHGEALVFRVLDHGVLDAVERIRQRALAAERGAEFIGHRLVEEGLERAPLKWRHGTRRFGKHFVHLLAAEEFRLGARPFRARQQRVGAGE